MIHVSVRSILWNVISGLAVLAVLFSFPAQAQAEEMRTSSYNFANDVAPDTPKFGTVTIKNRAGVPIMFKGVLDPESLMMSLKPKPGADLRVTVPEIRGQAGSIGNVNVSTLGVKEHFLDPRTFEKCANGVPKLVHDQIMNQCGPDVNVNDVSRQVQKPEVREYKI